MPVNTSLSNAFRDMNPLIRNSRLYQTPDPQRWTAHSTLLIPYKQTSIIDTPHQLSAAITDTTEPWALLSNHVMFSVIESTSQLMALFLKFVYQPILKAKPEQTNKMTTALNLFSQSAELQTQKSQLPLTTPSQWPTETQGSVPCTDWPHSAI